MGNNKIKEMLASLFTKPEDFRNVCVKHLVNNSCPNNKSHTTFDTLGILADAGDLSVLSYILYVKKQYATNIKEYADELNKDVVAIAEQIKKVKNSNEFVVIVKDIASKAGIKNDEFFSILENNCQEKNFLGYYNAILSSLIVYAVKTENSEDYDKINFFATKLLQACLGTIETGSATKKTTELREQVFQSIQKSYPEVLDDAKKLLNNYSIFSALAETTNSVNYIRYNAKYTQDIDKDSDAMMYYENCVEKPLISSNKEVASGTTISDAISIGCNDWHNNSQYIAYALSEIEKQVREKYTLQDPANVLASQITFLTLLDELNKDNAINISNEILFAFANPIIEFKHSMDIENFNKAVLASKEISNKILGYDINFDIYKSDDIKPENDKDNIHDDNSQTPDDNDNDNNKKGSTSNGLDKSGNGSKLDKIIDTIKPIIKDKTITKLAPKKILEIALNEISRHGKKIILGLSKKVVKAYLSNNQKDLQSEIANELLDSKIQKKLKDGIKNSNKLKISFNLTNKNADEYMNLLMETLSELYNSFDKEREKIVKLFEDYKNGIISKQEYDDEYEKYKASLKAGNLTKLLRKAINDKVYRKISVFGDDYSDNYK